MEVDKDQSVAPDDDGAKRGSAGFDAAAGTNSEHQTTIDPEAKKMKRTIKPLPPWLENFPPENIYDIHCAVEVYKQGAETLEHRLAQYVDIETNENGVLSTKRVDLQNELNLCQLRRFCRQLGLKQTGSSTKHGCRRAIAHSMEYDSELNRHGLLPQSAEARARNTLMRMVNVVLGGSFIDRFLSLNDLKRRVDHETGQMVKNFWVDAADCHNDFADNDDCQLHIVNNSNDEDLKRLINEELEPVSLQESENVTASMVQKKIMTLLKIRRLMKDNMQVSGTHSHTPLHFIDVAINKTKGGRMFNRLGVYYFYLRAEEYSEQIDAVFQPGLSDQHSGSTAAVAATPEILDMSFEESSPEEISDSQSRIATTPSRGQSRRKNRITKTGIDDNKEVLTKAITAITGISENTSTMAVEMRRLNDLEQMKVSIEQMKLKIEMAKALGLDLGPLLGEMNNILGGSSTPLLAGGNSMITLLAGGSNANPSTGDSSIALLAGGGSATSSTGGSNATLLARLKNVMSSTRGNNIASLAGGSNASTSSIGGSSATLWAGDGTDTSSTEIE